MNNTDNADYSQGKVYKVWSKNHGLCYYGSTVKKLAQRMSEHRGACNTTTSKQIIDAGDADIELVQDFPCMNKHELEDREAEVIQADWGGCVNEVVPGAKRRAGGEKAYKKEWYEENAVRIRARDSKKYQCECGGKYTHQHKARHFKSKKHQDHVEAEVASVMNDMISVLEAE